jgi:hypothetical protein
VWSGISRCERRMEGPKYMFITSANDFRNTRLGGSRGCWECWAYIIQSALSATFLCNSAIMICVSIHVDIISITDMTVRWLYDQRKMGMMQTKMRRRQMQCCKSFRVRLHGLHLQLWYCRGRKSMWRIESCVFTAGGGLHACCH